MLVLPCVFVGLLWKERRLIINSAVAGDPLHGLPHVEDPCEAIIADLLHFEVVDVSFKLPSAACRVENCSAVHAGNVATTVVFKFGTPGHTA